MNLPRHLRISLSVAALCALAGSPAHAAVFVVNTTTDSLVGNPLNCPLINRPNPPNPLPPGTCSLRDAVEAANALDGDDEIVFNVAGADRVTLLAPLEIDETVEINAPSLAGILNPFTRVVLTAAPGVDRLLEISDGETVLGNPLLEGGDIEILLGNLVFGQTTDATYEENISGTGSIEKDGAGRLTLTGTNTYTGGTTVSQGILQGDTLSIPGNVVIASGATLVFDQESGDPADFAGQIAGAGTLEKDGPGTLRLMAPSTFTGQTTITEGTLIGFANGAVGSLAGDITNNAQLVFDQTNNGVFAGDIDGTGSVEKRGVGTLTLQGSNSFGGALTIMQGVVIGNSSSLPSGSSSSIVLAAELSPGVPSGAQLIFDQENPDATPLNGTHSGSISGGGGLPADQFTLIKRGAGTLTLGGTNTYIGGTLVEEGALEGSTQSLQGEISLGSAATTLIFNQTGAGTFAGLIDGDGALVKRGSGSVAFTQTQLLGAGVSTALEAGQLEIGVAGQGDGAGTLLPGAMVISSGATLAGIGSVGGAVTNNGTISPASAGTGVFQVGSVSFGPNGVLAVNASGAGTDQLVAGSAQLGSSAVLDVELGSMNLGVPAGSIALDDTVLAAAGGVNGTLFSIDEDFAFFDASVTGTPTSVNLVLTRNANDLSDLALTQNQQAVADALEEALGLEDPGDGMVSDLELVFEEIGSLQTDQIPKALDDMAGEQLTQFATTRFAIADRFLSGLQQRVRGVAWGDGEALIAQQAPGGDAWSLAGNPILGESLPGLGQGLAQLGAQSMSSILDSVHGFQPEEGELGLGGWLDGYGLFGSLSGDSDTRDLDYTVGGVSLGLDYRVTKNWLIGAAGGYAYSDLDFDGLSGSQTANTGQGALYGGYVTPWLQIGAAARFGYSVMDSSREIGFIDRDADADFDGWDAGGRIEGALDLYEIGGVELQPLASFTYTHLEQDEIEESGADSLDLEGESESLESLVSGVGARVHAVFQIDRDLWFHPEFQARWLHEFGDRDREIEARIGGTPGAVYTVEGTQIPADSGVFGIGWSIVMAGRLHAFIGYDVVVNESLVQHAGTLGVKTVW